MFKLDYTDQYFIISSFYILMENRGNFYFLFLFP